MVNTFFAKRDYERGQSVEPFPFYHPSPVSSDPRDADERGITLPKSDTGRSDNKRKKFLVGYADCMYCDADDVKLFIILPGLDSEKPELVTDHLCNHLRRKKDKPGTILIRFVSRIPRIEKEAKL